jgi:hypothetical protein
LAEEDTNLIDRNSKENTILRFLFNGTFIDFTTITPPEKKQSPKGPYPALNSAV